MIEDIRRYQKKPEYVTAFQWNGEDVERPGMRVVEYPGSKDKMVRQLRIDNARTLLRYANPGQYIVETEYGLREIMNEDAFFEKYEEMP